MVEFALFAIAATILTVLGLMLWGCVKGLLGLA